MSRRFSFLLPNDWWRIPLVNEEARTANIDHLVDHQFANIDQAAQLRHDLKEELHKQASYTEQAGGMVMALYLLTVENEPISATMTCYDISGVLSLPEEFDPAWILSLYVGDDELRARLPDPVNLILQENARSAITESTGFEQLADITTNPDTSSSCEWVAVSDYDILAYRRERVSPGTDYFGEDTPKIKQLQVTYAQVVPDFGLVQTVFSTPVIQARDAWIQMWDAVVATFHAGAPEPTTHLRGTV